MKQTLLQHARSITSHGRLKAALTDAPVVAYINGPACVIEMIVQEAIDASGIDMDWAYCGGRGYIKSKGNRRKCRSALYSAIPQSTDLSVLDL